MWTQFLDKIAMQLQEYGVVGAHVHISIYNLLYLFLILYVFSSSIIDCLMLVLVAEFTSTNNLFQVEKQQLLPQLLEIISPEMATLETKKWLC